MIPYNRFSIYRHVTSLGAFGMLNYRSDPSTVEVPICCTLERVYEINGVWTTKIPDSPQGHHCTREMYNKGGYETFEVWVPGHEDLKFHIGNWVDDSEGCPLLGESFTDFDPAVGIQEAVIGSSKAAFDEFMRLNVGVESFFLKVWSF